MNQSRESSCQNQRFGRTEGPFGNGRYSRFFIRLFEKSFMVVVICAAIPSSDVMAGDVIATTGGEIIPPDRDSILRIVPCTVLDYRAWPMRPARREMWTTIGEQLEANKNRTEWYVFDKKVILDCGKNQNYSAQMARGQDGLFRWHFMWNSARSPFPVCTELLVFSSKFSWREIELDVDGSEMLGERTEPAEMAHDAWVERLPIGLRSTDESEDVAKCTNSIQALNAGPVHLMAAIRRHSLKGKNTAVLAWTKDEKGYWTVWKSMSPAVGVPEVIKIETEESVSKYVPSGVQIEAIRFIVYGGHSHRWRHLNPTRTQYALGDIPRLDLRNLDENQTCTLQLGRAIPKAGKF